MKGPNEKIPVNHGSHSDMALGFRGYKGFRNGKLPQIAGMILVEMGQDHMIAARQLGNRPLVAAHIVEPQGIPLLDDSNICRQRIL